MSILANVKVKEMERVLIEKGFFVKNTKGSHRTFKHSNGRRTTLAYHQGISQNPLLPKSSNKQASLLMNLKNSANEVCIDNEKK